MAPFWHPLRLASEAALVDIMSNGRLDFGIARGAYQSEFDRMTDGMIAKDGGGPLREMIPALQKLWQGDYAHENGTHFSFPTSTAVPRALQKPFPPMWVAAREQESHDYALANDCNVMITPLSAGDEVIEMATGRFDQAVANNPDKPRPKLMALRHTWVHEEGEDWRTGVKALRSWYGHFSAWFKNDQMPENGFVKPLTEEQMQASPGMDMDELRKNLLVGTPTEVTARLKHYEALGIDQFSFWSDNTMSHAEKKKSLQLFIDKVMPNF